MHITINGETYHGVRRRKTAQAVEFVGAGLEELETVTGVIARFRDDDEFEIGRDRAEDYARIEPIAGGFRLTNAPELVAAEPATVELTAKQTREQAYETEPCVEYDGEVMTIDEANRLYLAYTAEGAEARAQELRTRIAVAKAEIRARYPDEE